MVNLERTCVLMFHYFLCLKVNLDLEKTNPSSVPVVALTATATAHVRQHIVSSLKMSNVHIIEGSPNRENIKYITAHISRNKPYTDPDTWAWLTSRLNRLEGKMPRIVIYCRSRTQCSSLYGIFKKYVDIHKHFAMYHATTPNDVQKNIVKDFEHEDGEIRVLFATIAFGMGVDAKGLHTILHLGIPSDIDDYIQESGRAGRDQQQSISVLLTFPGMLAETRAHNRIREFVQNTEKCRRKQLLGYFEVGSHQHIPAAHTCCDICAVSCKCEGETCVSTQACQEETDTLMHFGFEHPGKGDIKECPRRTVSNDQRQALKEKLLQYRGTLLDESISYLAGGDIACGLPLSTIDKITMECSAIVPYEIYKVRYAIYNDSIRQVVFELVGDTLSTCPREQTIHYEDEEDAASENDSNINEDDIDYTASDDEDEWNEDAFERWAIFSNTDV